MQLRPGLRLTSTVCTTSVVVVRAPHDDLDVRCGGAPMVPHDADRSPSGPPAAAHAAGTLVGKRYWDEATNLELMCTSPGEGSLSLGEEPLGVKPATPLPSSD